MYKNNRLAAIKKAIADKNGELVSLGRAAYKGLIKDTEFFLAEQKELSEQIAQLEEDRKSVVTISNDWKEKATGIFMFARYAKEDFDSDNWERKRTVIKMLGADLKLSGRTIELTPVKYLVPVAESQDSLKAKKETARTAPQ